MIKPSELTWDQIVQVGSGTLGGNYLRCFWWPVALAEEVKDIPVPVKILGEELVLFRDLSGELTLLGATARTAGLRSNTASFKPRGFAAPTTAGVTTGAAESSTAPPSRSRPRPTFSIRGIRQKNWAGLSSPTWERIKRTRRRCRDTMCWFRTAIGSSNEATAIPAKLTTAIGCRAWRIPRTPRT